MCVMKNININERTSFSHLSVPVYTKPLVYLQCTNMWIKFLWLTQNICLCLENFCKSSQSPQVPSRISTQERKSSRRLSSVDSLATWHWTWGRSTWLLKTGHNKSSFSKTYLLYKHTNLSLTLGLSFLAYDIVFSV